MNKSRRHRQRRHNGKLSRRMKKRGGLPPKSSLKNTPSASNSNRVRISSIVNTVPLYRPTFFERVKVFEPEFKPDLSKPTAYEYEGQHITFTIPTKAGLTKFTVNKSHDEEEQRKAFVRFDNKFRNIQNYMTNKLSSDLELHDGQWMCVKAGNGIWHPSGKHEGSWTMLPKKVNCVKNVTDEFVRSEPGKQWISAQNDEHIFCVPKNYRSIMTLHELGADAVVIAHAK